MEVEKLIDALEEVEVMFMNYSPDSMFPEEEYVLRQDYKRCREILLEEYHTTQDRQFKDIFPLLIYNCSTFGSFWPIICNKFEGGVDQQTYISSDFIPIKVYLEEKKYKQNTKKIIPLRIMTSNENIQDTINKARQRIEDGDFEGAITSAKTLVEGILKELYRELKSEEPLESDLPGLYKLIVPLLNLDISEDLDNCLKKILSGLYSVNDGIANLRNVAGDAHATKFKPMIYHALLAVNCAFTFSQFLCDTYLCQKDKKDKDIIK